VIFLPGTPYNKSPLSNLTVKFSISGTAKNGYDSRIRENIRMRNPQASLIIKPVDDFLLEGDETVTIMEKPVALTIVCRIILTIKGRN
jgi:hypothetical protein